MKILIVEDDRICKGVAAGFLNKFFGYTNVRSVSLWHEAMLEFKNSTYDVVFMDVGIAQFSGIELTEFFRVIEKRKKIYASIIAITGYAGINENNQECLSAGMNYIIPKPYNPQHIEDALIYCGLRTKGQPWKCNPRSI